MPRDLPKDSPIMTAADVIVYTREGCHLCDDARDLLIRHGIDPTMINIDENAELKKKYDACVPVVSIGGKVRFRGRINEPLLRRILKRL